MDRKEIIEQIVKKLEDLSYENLITVADFVDFLQSKTDEKILNEGIQKMTGESKSFKQLKDEEDIYTNNDLKEKY